jgi:hypothetical protein
MSAMIGTRLDQVVKHRAAVSGSSYIAAFHEVVSEGGPLVRCYVNNELTPADLFVRLEKIVAAVSDLMPHAGGGVTAGSASMLAGEAQTLLGQLVAMNKLAALPGYRQDAEIAQLARKIDRLEQRLLGEARSVGARAAAPASASSAYQAPSQAFAEPLPLRAERPPSRQLGSTIPTGSASLTGLRRAPSTASAAHPRQRAVAAAMDQSGSGASTVIIRRISSVLSPSAIGRRMAGSTATSYSSSTTSSIRSQCTASPVRRSMTIRPQRGSASWRVSSSSRGRPLKVRFWRGLDSPITANGPWQAMPRA